MSVLLRILTNYFHLISMFMILNFQLPSNVIGIFSVTDRVSSPDETFFSFDCFIRDYEIKFFAPSNELFKIFLYNFFPMMLILVIAGLFGLIIYIHKAVVKLRSSDQAYRGSLFDYKRSLVVSMICIIFLFHPTLTLKSLSVFLCTEIDEGEYRMMFHLEYQ